MTQAETLRAIRHLGLLVRVRDGEFRVTFPGLSVERAEAVAYYTEDREDALGTARAMIRFHQSAVAQANAIAFASKP